MGPTPSARSQTYLVTKRDPPHIMPHAGDFTAGNTRGRRERGESGPGDGSSTEVLRQFCGPPTPRAPRPRHRPNPPIHHPPGARYGPVDTLTATMVGSRPRVRPNGHRRGKMGRRCGPAVRDGDEEQPCEAGAYGASERSVGAAGVAERAPERGWPGPPHWPPRSSGVCWAGRPAPRPRPWSPPSARPTSRTGRPARDTCPPSGRAPSRCGTSAPPCPSPARRHWWRRRTPIPPHWTRCAGCCATPGCTPSGRMRPATGCPRTGR